MGLEKRRLKTQIWNRVQSPTILLSCFCVFLITSCKQPKKYHDSSSAPRKAIRSSDLLKSQMNQDSLLFAAIDFQDKLDESFRDPDESPLTASDKMVFSGLDFFTANANFIVEAKLVRTPETLPFGMPTSTERMSQERLFGKLFFTLKGLPFELNVYESQDLLEKEGYEDYLFLPFTDLSNGATTYGGGRYLDLRLPEGDQILLDFNRAYNPYCAYNKKYSCPIVPSENHLNVAVEAGVKAFK